MDWFFWEGIFFKQTLRLLIHESANNILLTTQTNVDPWKGKKVYFKHPLQKVNIFHSFQQHTQLQLRS